MTGLRPRWLRPRRKFGRLTWGRFGRPSQTDPAELRALARSGGPSLSVFARFTEFDTLSKSPAETIVEHALPLLARF